MKSAVLSKLTEPKTEPQESHLARLLARHGCPHVDGGAPGAEGRGRHVGREGGSGEDHPGLGLGAAVRGRRWGGGGRGGGVGTSGGG